MPTHPDLLRGVRVLIVEDEALIAEELVERLSRAGMQVVGSLDAAHLAIEAALRERPDIVLMDVRLRGDADGIETATTIRRQIDVPIIFLTAHSDRATLDRAQEAESFAYLVQV